MHEKAATKSQENILADQTIITSAFFTLQIHTEKNVDLQNAAVKYNQ